MPRLFANRLLVEGNEEKRVIPYLMDEHVVWGDTEQEWKVAIQSLDGVENLLKPGLVEAELRTRGLEALGIVVDGDSDPSSTWRRVRERCLLDFPAFPEAPVAEGIILSNDAGLRIGVWMMPDNSSTGMLETFLRSLAEQESVDLWNHVKTSSIAAKTVGAKFRDCHYDKALIHAYLSWMDPPGDSLAVAVLSKTIRGDSPNARPFVDWFCNLFRLDRRPSPTTGV